MLSAKSKWNLSNDQTQIAETLAAGLNIPNLIARLLVARGFKDARAASEFMHVQEDQWHDPFLLDGMSLATERIRKAIEEGERIRIYGDYDADGVSSTALMSRLMQRLSANFDTYIPHRQREGYGLNNGAIDLASEAGVTLIITVDTGISAVEQIAYAKQCGIDVVVTDHHEPPEILPEAYALINPRKPSCLYPFKSLAGVGVAFKLAHALLGEPPLEWLELVTVGTVADLMPLLDENRLIVRFGLERMRQEICPGLQALCRLSGIDSSHIGVGHIGFSIAPRINASGRLEDADIALHCLLSESLQEADGYAIQLDELNRERQYVVEQLTESAVKQAAEQLQADELDKVLVVAGEDWNSGVVGIVASRLLERFYRPAIVLGIDRESGLAKGSARSIPAFHIVEALHECSTVLDHYGGHHAAAGMTLSAERIDELRKRLNTLASEILHESDLIPTSNADLSLTLADITVSNIKMLEKVAPFGMGNPTPKFIISDATIQQIRRMGKEQQHLKLVVSQTILGSSGVEQTVSLEAVGFGKGGYSRFLTVGAKVDLLVELGINEWNGAERPQMIVHDMRVNERQIFDWRGKTIRDSEVQEWLIGNDAVGNSEAQGIVIGVQVKTETPEWNDLFAPDSKWPVWKLAQNGEPNPCNERASAMDPQQIVDLLLINMPLNVDIWSNALKKFPKAGRIYAMPGQQEPSPFAGHLPDREQFKTVYGYLRSAAEWPRHGTIEAMSRRSGLSPSVIQWMLDVFRELNFVELTNDKWIVSASPSKSELRESESFRRGESTAVAERHIYYSSGADFALWIQSLTMEELV